MGLIAAVLNLFSGLLSFLRGSKDRQIGRDEQKIEDVSVMAEISQKMNEAASNSPETREELEGVLKKGDI